MLGVGAGRDFRLGGWLVQPAQCRLSKDGRTVQVRAKVKDLLAYLASRQAAADVHAVGSQVAVGASRRTARVSLALVLMALAAFVSAAFLWRSRAESSNLGSDDLAWTTANPLTSFHGSEGSPSFSPDGSQVAFHWDGSNQGNLDVYVAGVGGGLALSPDERTLLVPLVDAEGSDLMLVEAPR